MNLDQTPPVNPADYVIPCHECQAGQMHRNFVVYYTWIGDDLITVPDFPAWVCDICGRREYDLQALTQLSLILSPNAGRSTNRKRRIQTRPAQRRKATRPSQPE
jgi:YgiT-type zinc finger domain-containing protein